MVPRSGRLVETGDRYEPYRLVDPTACRWWRWRPTSGICRRRGGRRRRSAPTGWICCGGSGSCGPIEVSRGIGRRGSRPGTSAAGCRSRASRLARTGARQERRPDHPMAGRVVGRTRRRCARTARRCCAASTTSTATRAPGRSSTRSRWTGRAAAGRAHAHHNPMEPHRNERSGLYRPTVPSRIPRSVPDERVQRDLRPAAVAPGPGTGRLLRLHRGAGLGAAVGHAGRRRPGPAADHGGAQGNPRDRRSCRRRPTRSCGCGSTRWRWPS